MKLIQLAGVAILLFSMNIAYAGAVIKIQHSDGMATILTDGKFARMNSSDDEYVLIDYKKQTVKIVSPKSKQVMLLDAKKTFGANSAVALRTSIKALGTGTTVAGYPTQKYAYSANGKSCGVIYGSVEVYQKKGIKELLQAMTNMMQKQQAMLGGFAGMIDDCTLADMKLNDHVKEIGVPMRTEKNGVVDSEIKSIKLDVDLAADTFVIPASYKIMTMEQQIREAKKQASETSQQMQQYQPQIQQMMQQMQQSGQMPPEMMQQMQRAQEMMKQYQQR